MSSTVVSQQETCCDRPAGQTSWREQQRRNKVGLLCFFQNPILQIVALKFAIVIDKNLGLDQLRIFYGTAVRGVLRFYRLCVFKRAD
jgi:hypothetical protein